MKKCTKCQEELPLDNFNKNKARKDGYATMCRSCWKKYYHEYYKTGKERARLAKARANERIKIREYIAEVKSVPCMDCKVKYPSFVMDFDHRDPKVKSFTIGKSVSSISFAALLREIAKCDVVCSNCHRIRTHGINTDRPEG